MLRISTKVEFKNKVSKPYNIFLTLVENTYSHNTNPYCLIYRILQLNLARTHVKITSRIILGFFKKSLSNTSLTLL